MRVRLLFLPLLIFTFAACQSTQEPGYVVKGTIKNGYNGYVYLFKPDSKDSTLAKDGVFEFTGSVPHVIETGIAANPMAASNSIYFGNEVVELSFSMEQQYLSLESVTSPTADLIDSVSNYIGAVFDTSANPNPPLFTLLEGLLKAHPDNQFVTELVSDVVSEDMLSLEQAKALLALIDQKSMIPQYLDAMQTFMNRMENLNVGDPFPNFELTSLTGETVNTADYRGSFLLVDFWASWCVPCRKAHPEYMELYNAFHKKGFDILSVSIDGSKESWKAAVEKDGLTWANVHEEGEFQSELVKKLGVVFLPFNYLVDPDGNIFLIESDPAEIEQVLKNQLGSVSSPN